MTMRKIDLRATVYLNDKFCKIQTMSQGMLDYAEPELPPFYLSPLAEDELLGCTLRQALAASKKVSKDEFQRLWKSGILHALGDKISTLEIKNYSYKNKRDLYKVMRCCWISEVDGQIEIKPTHHKSLDSYSGISNDGPEIFILPRAVSDAEVGAALREGFKRCT